MEIDRQSIRTRPPGKPIMYQTWDKLLFMHWPVPEAMLRPLIPAPLAIDTFDGTAWIGVAPFTMWGVRPRWMPALPVVSTTHELNVRTYVHVEGVPGVWFLSLDASSPLAVLGARIGFSLPYFQARMTLDDRDQAIRFTSQRIHPGAPPAAFEATWRGGASLPAAQPGSRAFFLIERYCLYATRRGHLFRTRIFHDPWPLRRAELDDFRSTMVESHGLPTPHAEPLLHGQAAPLEVEIWPPERMGYVGTFGRGETGGGRGAKEKASSQEDGEPTR